MKKQHQFCFSHVGCSALSLNKEMGFDHIQLCFHSVCIVSKPGAKSNSSSVVSDGDAGNTTIAVRAGASMFILLELFSGGPSLITFSKLTE